VECEIADCGLRIADCESGEIARIRNWEPRRNKNMVTSVPSTIRDPQSEIRNCQSAIGNPKIAYLSAMKKLLFILTFLFTSSAMIAQSDTTMQKFADSVCSCLNRGNLNDIKTRAEAEATVTNCFLKGNMNLLMQLADERKITVTDQQAMRKIGEEVGMQLMRRNCDAFVQLSMKMAQESNGERTSFSKTSGTLSAVETKDFCKLILTESNGKKSSFYWLHHFTNSEKFVGQPAKYIGKKVKITWEDTEVYLPAMKDYFKIKEIKEIELL